MKIIIKDNYEEMSIAATLLMSKKIKTNPKIVLGLATGSTPELTYKLLIKENLD
jgi:glucosamine-6-phosphate deaminase